MVASRLKVASDATLPAPDMSRSLEDDHARASETLGQSVRRLQMEVHRLAMEEVELFAHDLDAMAIRAAEIAEGGEAYPVGIRELASRLAADLPQKALGITAILDRSTGPALS